MLSINTNLSSLIAQQSLSSSTTKLNQAIERMSTGFKINHAKDNAANYSISTNMSTQIGAYDVAANNVAMGMDLVTTASDIISTMQDHATRLQALSTQARNGTYGEQSMSAINSEAAVIMAEINRLYSTAEYNGISLFNNKAYEIDPSLPKAGASGFIEEPIVTFAMRAVATPTAGIAEGEVVGTTTEAPKAKAEYNGFIEDPKTYTDAEVAAMTRVRDVSTFTSGESYAIYTVEELQKLADYVNSNKDTRGIEFVLGADIDLSSVGNWTPIGETSSKSFKGTFDGNGHVIKNLTINNPTEDYQGLFGFLSTLTAIKNVGIIEGDVKGKSRVGGLAGDAGNCPSITNSYATVAVTGENIVGGLVGFSSDYISNCYASGTVSGTGTVGGLLGYSNGSHISNSYATGNVCGTEDSVGGLLGFGSTSSSISNCYATGNVTGTSKVGGLAGNYNASVTNSYATGNVTGTGDYTGGLIGYNSRTNAITNSYTTGVVNGVKYTGGLVGYTKGDVTNCYTTGNVSGNSSVGGLVGSSSSSIANSYATGTVSGDYQVGGLAGSAAEITNSYATGNVTGTSYTVGGLAGSATDITNSCAIGAVSGDSSVGGLVGNSSTITNSYATGSVSGTSTVGGLAGSAADITNSYAEGNVYGTEQVGGLVGVSYGSITNNYATGTVKGTKEVGGLIGYSSSSNISNNYATGNVSGDNYIGGLLGKAYCADENVEINDSISYSTVNGNSAVGSLVGGVVGTCQYIWNYGDGDEGVDEYSDGELLLTNCSAIANNDYIGGVYKQIEYDICYEDPDTGDWIEDYDYYGELDTTFDLSVYDTNITAVDFKNIVTTLQVGINSDSSCQIDFDTNFKFDLSSIEADISSDEALASIMEFTNLLSEKSTQLGAVQNRLDSAIESIEVNLNNLTSSLSTIRDADIAEVSSEYIRQQILQQASATLLATANQSPSIALQLI